MISVRIKSRVVNHFFNVYVFKRKKRRRAITRVFSGVIFFLIRVERRSNILFSTVKISGLVRAVAEWRVLVFCFEIGILWNDEGLLEVS